MIDLYKCLEEYKVLHPTNPDFLMDFFKSYQELHLIISELRYLLDNDPDNHEEIQSLLKCIDHSETSIDDHVSEIKDFTNFFNHSSALDGILKTKDIGG